MGMNATDIRRLLEKEFEGTFIWELIPGVLHNFASPLNGIMGRAKLLQRRVEDHIGRVRREHPDVGKRFDEEFRKISKDLELLNQESDRLHEMFKNVAGKIYVVSDGNEQRINLSELIDNEIRFSDFYLDFKHNIKKKVELDPEVPDVTGTTADFSIFITTLVRHSLGAMKDSRVKEFHLSVAGEGPLVRLRVRDTGKAPPPGLKEALAKGQAPQAGTGEADRLLCAFGLLRKYGAVCDVTSEGQWNVYTVAISCRGTAAKQG